MHVGMIAIGFLVVREHGRDGYSLTVGGLQRQRPRDVVWTSNVIWPGTPTAATHYTHSLTPQRHILLRHLSAGQTL